jgi:uncharacterized protein
MTSAKLKVFLIKIKARCNINCTYCYEYNLSDQSWRDKPGSMSEETLLATVNRISEYALEKELRTVHIVFHGGEPLLAPLDFFEKAINLFKELLPKNCSIKFAVQTNGILINEKLLDIFLKLDISIGISIDGTKEANDRYRLDFQGKSTFEHVYSGLKLLNNKKYKSINGGVLTVIDPQNPPLETYNFLKATGAGSIEFLMPHHNYISLPNFPIGDTEGSISSWLIQIFDEWYNNNDDIVIRMFEHIIHLLLGGIYSVENLGLAPVELIVVQTDGSYEAVDSLKATFNGAVYTGKNVFKHSFDEVLTHNLIGTRLDRINNLSETCTKCNFVKICGGGYIPHRYSQEGFLNPSIYCKDLYRLIDYIKSKISEINGIEHIVELIAQPLKK